MFVLRALPLCVCVCSVVAVFPRFLLRPVRSPSGRFAGAPPAPEGRCFGSPLDLLVVVQRGPGYPLKPEVDLVRVRFGGATSPTFDSVA